MDPHHRMKVSIMQSDDCSSFAPAFLLLNNSELAGRSDCHQRGTTLKEKKFTLFRTQINIFICNCNGLRWQTERPIQVHLRWEYIWQFHLSCLNPVQCL